MQFGFMPTCEITNAILVFSEKEEFVFCISRFGEGF